MCKLFAVCFGQAFAIAHAYDAGNEYSAGNFLYKTVNADIIVGI